MLNIILTRTFGNDRFTEGVIDLQLGDMTITHYCRTLEPAVRRHRRKGKTAIPEGTYEIWQGVSQKFKRQMPYLMNVPGFEGIMIHPGNTVKDTEGCILVGEYASRGLIKNSRRLFEALNSQINKSIEQGQRPKITVRNGKEIIAC